MRITEDSIMIKLQKNIAFFMAFVASTWSFPAKAIDLAKEKTLSDIEEKRWIEAVKTHVTADGATVAQVLEFVENLRPRKFKVASIDVGYNGSSGEPEVVIIDYWIGNKRLKLDAFTDLMYEVKSNGKAIIVSPEINKYTKDTTVNSMESGRESFLRNIDQMYDDQCVDPDDHRKFC